MGESERRGERDRLSPLRGPTTKHGICRDGRRLADRISILSSKSYGSSLAGALPKTRAWGVNQPSARRSPGVSNPEGSE